MHLKPRHRVYFKSGFSPLFSDSFYYVLRAKHWNFIFFYRIHNSLDYRNKNRCKITTRSLTRFWHFRTRTGQPLWFGWTDPVWWRRTIHQVRLSTLTCHRCTDRCYRRCRKPVSVFPPNRDDAWTVPRWCLQIFRLGVVQSTFWSDGGISQ